MSIRDKLVLISRKLALFCFFGTFAYALVANGLNSAYGFRPEYAVFFFASAFFFFGLMTLPTSFGFTKNHFLSYLLPTSFFFAFLGITLLFGRLILFAVDPNEDSLAMLGVFFFIWAIVLMIASAIPGDASTYRSFNDVSDVKSEFEKVAKTLGLNLRNLSVPERFEMSAEGTISSGILKLNVKNDLKVPYKMFSFQRRENKRNLINSSTIELNLIDREIKYPASIITVNEAIEIKGFSEDIEKMLRKFIEEKQLNYFNFRLLASGNEIRVEVHLAVEEEGVWLDYIELIKLVLTYN